MKCPLCEYEYEEEFQKEGMYYKPIIGDEPFIKIEGSFHITIKYDFHADDIRKVLLYACPKCNNVIMQDTF